MQPLTPSQTQFLGEVFSAVMQDGGSVSLPHLQALMGLFNDRRKLFAAQAASDSKSSAEEAAGKLAAVDRALLLLKCAVEWVDGTPGVLRAPIPA